MKSKNILFLGCLIFVFGKMQAMIESARPAEEVSHATGSSAIVAKTGKMMTDSMKSLFSSRNSAAPAEHVTNKAVIESEVVNPMHDASLGLDMSSGRQKAAAAQSSAALAHDAVSSNTQHAAIAAPASSFSGSFDIASFSHPDIAPHDFSNFTSSAKVAEENISSTHEVARNKEAANKAEVDAQTKAKAEVDRVAAEKAKSDAAAPKAKSMTDIIMEWINKVLESLGLRKSDIKVKQSPAQATQTKASLDSIVTKNSSLKSDVMQLENSLDHANKVASSSGVSSQVHDKAVNQLIADATQLKVDSAKNPSTAHAVDAVILQIDPTLAKVVDATVQGVSTEVAQSANVSIKTENIKIKSTDQLIADISKANLSDSRVVADLHDNMSSANLSNADLIKVDQAIQARNNEIEGSLNLQKAHDANFARNKSVTTAASGTVDLFSSPKEAQVISSKVSAQPVAEVRNISMRPEPSTAKTVDVKVKPVDQLIAEISKANLNDPQVYQDMLNKQMSIENMTSEDLININKAMQARNNEVTGWQYIKRAQAQSGDVKAASSVDSNVAEAPVAKLSLTDQITAGKKLKTVDSVNKNTYARDNAAAAAPLVETSMQQTSSAAVSAATGTSSAKVLAQKAAPSFLGDITSGIDVSSQESKVNVAAKPDAFKEAMDKRRVTISGDVPATQAELQTLYKAESYKDNSREKVVADAAEVRLRQKNKNPTLTEVTDARNNAVDNMDSIAVVNQEVITNEAVNQQQKPKVVLSSEAQAKSDVAQKKLQEKQAQSKVVSAQSKMSFLDQVKAQQESSSLAKTGLMNEGEVVKNPATPTNSGVENPLLKRAKGSAGAPATTEQLQALYKNEGYSPKEKMAADAAEAKLRAGTVNPSLVEIESVREGAVSDLEFV